MGSLRYNVHFSVRLTLSAWREKILYLEASKKKVQITHKFLDGVFLGIKEGSEEFIGNTCWLCGVQNCQKIAW